MQSIALPSMSLSQANPNALPLAGEKHEFVPVPNPRREEALAKMLARDGPSDSEHARRFLRFADSHQVPLEHLYAAIDAGDRIRAVALGVPGAGRTAMLFASQPASSPESDLTASLINSLCATMGRAGTHLAQTLLEPEDTTGERLFAAAGFSKLATLSYLERPLRMRLLPPRPRWPAGFQVQPYEPSLHEQLIEAMDETYDQTLDCPGLRGMRETSDVVDGHQASGVFDPSLWFLLKSREKVQGLLLLNAAADHASIELVYIGLARAMRGRGLGRELLRHGLHALASRPERMITLAVDQANAPALALYAREHFRPVLSRVAMIRSLRA